MKDYLIIANGNFLVKEIIEEAAINKVIVALDGAYDKLIRLGFQPDILLGDFDSVSVHPSRRSTPWSSSGRTEDKISIASVRAEETHAGRRLEVRTENIETPITIIHTPDQNYTDLTKGIHYCDEQNATSITIVCGTGGRLDHHIGVIRTLRAQYKANRPILLHTEEQTARFAKDETVTICGEIGDKCGVVAFPSGTVTSKGLQYDSENFLLDFGFRENTCNALTETKATISVTGEALIIMPPMLLSQREFQQKSMIEKLELQLRDAKAINLI